MPESGPVTPELGKRLRMGQGVHRAIEGMFPGTASEKRGRYVEDGLPFAIDYHPDIWDRAESKLWEIKPLGWFFGHYDYCVAQLSGYRHFTGASLAGFMLYKLRRWNGGRITTEDIDGPWPYVPPLYNSWEYLRKISLESDMMLLRQKR